MNAPPWLWCAHSRALGKEVLSVFIPPRRFLDKLDELLRVRSNPPLEDSKQSSHRDSLLRYGSANLFDRRGSRRNCRANVSDDERRAFKWMSRMHTFPRCCTGRVGATGSACSWC